MTVQGLTIPLLCSLKVCITIKGLQNFLQSLSNFSELEVCMFHLPTGLCQTRNSAEMSEPLRTSSFNANVLSLGNSISSAGTPQVLSHR